MAKKDTFLLVSLQEEKAKEIAQIVTNTTCRRILDFMSLKEDTTESEIAKTLDIPISTVHYNLEMLKKARLIESEEYHYSPKGKEVSHYRLASKYIIIAPKSTHGIKEKLRSILPVGLLTAAAAFFVNILNKTPGVAREVLSDSLLYDNVVEETASGSLGSIASSPSSVTSVASSANSVTVPIQKEVILGVQQAVTEQSIMQSPVFWFIIGAVFAILMYLLIEHIRKRR